MRILALLFWFSIQAQAITTYPPVYQAPFTPMVSLVKMTGWLRSSDGMPDLTGQVDSANQGDVMLDCASTVTIITSQYPCYNTGAMTAADARLGSVAPEDRLAVIQYFSLRYQIQTNPSFFQLTFFDPYYIVPGTSTTTTTSLTAGVSYTVGAGASGTGGPPGNGPSVLNAYVACIRYRLNNLKATLTSAVTAVPSAPFSDPFAAQFNAPIKTAMQVSANSQLVSIQRQLKVIDYMFPDAYAWEMLLFATNTITKCTSGGASLP